MEREQFFGWTLYKHVLLSLHAAGTGFDHVCAITLLIHLGLYIARVHTVISMAMASFNCDFCRRVNIPFQEQVRLMVCTHVWCLDCVKFWVEHHYDARNRVFNARDRPICPLCLTPFLEGVRHKRDMEVVTQLLPIYHQLGVGIDFYVVCTSSTCPQYLVLNGFCHCSKRSRYAYNKTLQIFEVFQ